MVAIHNLESITTNITLDKLKEIEFKRAAGRGISIIGEVLYKANKIKKDLAWDNLKNKTGMRNMVIHDYDPIDTERL